MRREKETVEGKVPKKSADIRVPKRMEMRLDTAVQVWGKEAFFAK